MLFSSVVFLYVFLPLTLLTYRLAPKQARNTVLLIASLLFYFYGEQKYTLLLVISSLSDYVHGLYIESHRGQKGAKIALISSLIINLAMLGVFKYLDFFIGIVNSLLGTSIAPVGLPLPIGISFFTFQTMSYTIDVYRGDAHAQKNLISFAAYVCLFPQLVAGPIVRYTDIDTELSDRSVTVDDLAAGARRFAVGLGKKVLIANLLGELAALYPAAAEKTVLLAWTAAIAYLFQIYFDFSGYSDMAIGLGRMLGFHFPENFDHPYCSRSVTEFWRRWHMTMVGWFRDYVYIPLGGSRVGPLKRYRNILIVWMLTGLWHGAAWNFVVWGLCYGVLLIIEKRFLLEFLDRHRVFSHVYLLAVSVILFTVFGADSLSGAAQQLAVMFGGGTLWNGDAVYYLRSYAVILLVSAVGATPLLRDLARRVEHTRAATVLEPLVTAGLLLLSTAYLIDGSFNPFLYFRF
ncbi:MAG: MBOAT family O-acyltransferase [Oscillospiraceae bacterium]|nr:MBOAT family O-acyltransferase [Oscillospiraceae bacterium]